MVQLTGAINIRQMQIIDRLQRGETELQNKEIKVRLQFTSKTMAKNVLNQQCNWTVKDANYNVFYV